MSSDLLSRYAECLFWLARYVERAENLARIIDVNETFSRDSQGGQNWESIVQLNADTQRFAERHRRATADTVAPFYISDARNPTSIVSAIGAARENARTLRPLISTEMWVQLNMFHMRLKALRPRELEPGNLARLCAEIKEGCQTHAGITEGTLFRDQGWYFYEMGRFLERADQTTRLLDIKYHLLLPRVADVGGPIDISQWQALLRSVAGYHAFRRLYTSAATPDSVVSFLLHNASFPRSVALCIREASQRLLDLKGKYHLRGGNDAAERLDYLSSMIASSPVRVILENGLHEYLDAIQGHLGEATRLLSISFFGAVPILADEAAEAQ